MSKSHVVTATLDFKFSFCIDDIREAARKVVDAFVKKFGSFFVDHVTIGVLRCITGSQFHF